MSFRRDLCSQWLFFTLVLLNFPRTLNAYGIGVPCLPDTHLPSLPKPTIGSVGMTGNFRDNLQSSTVRSEDLSGTHKIVL